MKKFFAMLLLVILPLQAWSAAACTHLATTTAHSHAVVSGESVQHLEVAVSDADAHAAAETACDCCFSCHGGITKVVPAAAAVAILPDAHRYALSADSRYASADPSPLEHVPLPRLSPVTGRA